MKKAVKNFTVKKFDFPLVADTTFYAAVAFLVSIALLRYLRLPTGACIAISILVALAVACAVFLLIDRRHQRRALGKKRQAEKQALMLHLTLEKPERVRALLLDAYSKDGRNANCLGDELCVDGTLTVPLFTMQPISADAVAGLICRYGETPFTVACNAVTQEAEALLKTFRKGITCGEEIYLLFARTGTIPEKLICGNLPKRTIRSNLKRSFSKKNARPFFVSGILLLIMSLFVFFPLYYLITGSVLTLSAVFIRAFGSSETV